MPTYDQLLDAALLAVSMGKVAEREAVRALNEAYPAAPGGPALSTLASLWSGDLEEAQRLAEALGDRPPELAMRAEVAGYVGDRERADRLLEAAIAAAPDDPIVLRCAYSILGMDDPERALEIARRRVVLRPHDAGVYASLGTAMIGAGRTDEAERHAAQAPPAFETSNNLWVLRARLAMKRRDLPTAEAHAREAVARCSDAGMAWATLADILRHQGNKEEAARAAGFALELNSRNPMSMRVLASLAAARGDREEAARWEQKAEQAIPALAFMAGMRRANALAREGKPEAALAELAKLTSVPGHTRIAVRTMRLNLLLGMRDDAALVAEIAAMEAEGSQDPVLEHGRAEVDRRAGRTGIALGRLDALWRAGKRGDVAGPLIRVLAEDGDLDGARRVAADATADLPGTPADAGAVFLALDQAGLRDEARAFLDAAERRFPEAQPIRLLRVGMLAGDGNVHAMMHAVRSLDSEHRPTIRIRLSFLKIVRLLWRRALRR